jgi:hypothetical protein
MPLMNLITEPKGFNYCYRYRHIRIK